MSEILRGKRAIVTGASKGIGLAVAKAILAEGGDVVICARDEKRLERALVDLRSGAPGRKVAGRTADVSNSDDVRQLFEFADQELGGLNILINNAGMGLFRVTAELTLEEWNQVIGTNLSGAFYCSREALERFSGAGGGSIINISSLAGKNPFAGGAAYNASKFGLNGFSEAMMLDHRYDNVRVSYILPGSVETEFAGNDPAQQSRWKIAPEDIAEIVLDILRKPARTLISRVEVRPLRPQKD
ncbi:MAG: SDR family oxidoreductase [Acidobacteriaceae bacterium]|nr:SDR family oxidoreductase [Acidobacteriaceae bacterium]MBV9294646.1 SDR family oxidoreductase [Acidobacteriaceae bacterium]MBV9766901.1 SDR family oxidoreductase [Acidobacteriaceae bacterium]